ncbi:hypothetical protein L202_05470 [Cryptococcus amylolentus CBS 6039]|uniref:Cytochrome P450 n=1 Tax=Cryptococcus amylolentus CBS 6039 TaxID=1295533 RepID=A0A1E3HKK9_9TREE|nr:hypothetical protein L202_05470 [Cryptococcus amylolentus CBS 6039]ODN76883.1 hypothetical protein L202_05470 [Cryptococcus amylolentus CBS 6039]
MGHLLSLPTSLLFAVASRFLAAALLLVAAAYLYFWPIRRYFSHHRNLPGPYSSSVFWGALPYVYSFPHPTTAYQNWLTTYGPTFQYPILLGNSRIITADLAAISYILSHPAIFPKPVHVRAALREMIGDGLVSEEGDVHKRTRKNLNPSLGPAAVRKMVPIFYDKSRELAERLSSDLDDQRDNRINFLWYISRATLDMMGVAQFDHDFHALSGEAEEIVDAYTGMFQVGTEVSVMSVLQFLLPVFKRIPTNRTAVLDRSLRTARRFGRKIIREKRDNLRSFDLEKYQDHDIGLLASMREVQSLEDITDKVTVKNQATSCPDERLTDEEILDQVNTFMLAGYETTSTALCWCIYSLAKHPEIQERLRQELLEISEQQPDIDTLNALPYLDAVIKESLRLSAPVPLALREASQDISIPLSTPITGKDGNLMDRVEVGKGTTILMPISNANTQLSIWGPRAEEFLPSRWLTPTPETYPGSAKSVPGVYSNLLTFWGGSRSCIGFRFALAEIKVMLFVLIKSFRFEELENRPLIEKKFSIVSHPWVVEEENAGFQLPLKVSGVQMT